jgi:hypothetical protein
VKKSKNAYYTLSMYSNVQHLMKEEIDEKNWLRVCRQKFKNNPKR